MPSKANTKSVTIGPNVTKLCKICGRLRPRSDFYKSKPTCKECYKTEQNNYHALRKRYKTPPIGTPCECCGKNDEILHWDHCHNTKEHRGWLCGNCNTGIGKLGDNVSGVQQALLYLESMSNLEDADIKGDL